MKRAPNQPTGALHLYGGVFIREICVQDAGTLIPQHKHAFDHLSYLAWGGVRVWRDDELIGDFTAPAAIRIPAGAVHRFLTLSPLTLILCVHATDSAEIDAEPAPLELED